MKSISFAVPALLALAACDGGTQGTDVTADQAAADGNLAANGSVAPVPSASASVAVTEIPAAMQGRWGMVDADCEPGRADAKGLLTVTADKLEFYESVGTLDEIEQASATRIRASFDFEGEGMTWQRDGMLEIQNSGDTLIRREYGLDAAPGPFRYTKCNQGR